MTCACNLHTCVDQLQTKDQTISLIKIKSSAFYSTNDYKSEVRLTNNFMLKGFFQTGRSDCFCERIYSVILPKHFVLSLDIGRSSYFLSSIGKQLKIQFTTYHRSSELFQVIYFLHFNCIIA